MIDVLGCKINKCRVPDIGFLLPSLIASLRRCIRFLTSLTDE